MTLQLRIKKKKYIKNIAILGIGNWGKKITRTLYNLNVLKYICDVNKKKKYNIPYKSEKLILKNNKIDIVIIATPINNHFFLARKFIKKKHIFVEKPLVKKLLQLKKLNKLAKKYKKKIMVGHLLQYHYAFIKMMRLINSDYIGKIKKIHFTRTNYIKIYKTNDIIWDYGPHDISMLLKIIKKQPRNIKILSHTQKKKITSNINFEINFTKKLSSKIFLSWENSKKIQKLKIIGKKKTLTFNDTNKLKQKLTIYDVKNEIKFNIKLKYKEPLLNECECLIEFIKKKKIPITNQIESRGVIKILEEVEKKSKKNM